MNFLDAVNRVLRIESIISGDDDDLTSFSQTQHDAAINLAKISVQDELTALIAEEVIPFERIEGTITLATGTRTYNLAANFVRFDGQRPFFLKQDGSGDSENQTIELYNGGENQIRRDFLDYQSQNGTPTYYYMATPSSVSVKTVGLFQVPIAADNGDVYRYYYEKDVSVSAAGDNLPFNDLEANIFTRMAARHFKYLFSTKDVRAALFPGGIDDDPVIRSARATLMNLLLPITPTYRYGRRYGQP